MSDHRRGLNRAQEQAVDTTEGPLLVLAGAGTGKTRVVTCRIAEILARGATPDEICAVTFTNKAAREMRERVRKLLGGRDISGMVVSTFHSLGLRILREHGQRIGIPGNVNIADPGDQESILRDALREVGLGRATIQPRDAKFRISMWKNAGLSPEAALEDLSSELDEALAVAYRRYDDDLRRKRVVDFDDLILLPLKLFDEDRQALDVLRHRWRFLSIDEYQDTNGCQYRLVRHLASGHRNLCVVGDDDQSIYAWRGAESKRILGFKRDFPDAKVVTLENNYRSTPEILTAANTLIRNNIGRFDKQLRAVLPSGKRVHLYKATDEKDELDHVVRRLNRLKEENGIRHKDVAILFRANSQARPLEQALRQRDIPYKIVGTRSFFDRREIRDVLSYLRLAHNRQDDAAFLRIVNTPARGIGKGSVDKISKWAEEARSGLFEAMTRRVDELPARVQEGAQALIGAITDFEEGVPEKGVGDALEALIEAVQYRHHMKQLADDAVDLNRRETALDDLVQATRDHAARAEGGASLEAVLDAFSLQDDDRDDKKEDDSDAITLLTMHAAKGLEFPIVFIVGVEEGICPHQRVVAEEEEDPTTSGIDEERRLFYVAITRARKRLFMTCSWKRRRFGQEIERDISRFIEEIDESTFDILDTKDETPATAETASAWLAKIRSRFSTEDEESTA